MTSGSSFSFGFRPLFCRSCSASTEARVWRSLATWWAFSGVVPGSYPKLSFVDLAKVRSFLNEGIQVSLNQSIVPWIQREFTKILLFGLAGAAVAAQFSICVQLTTFMSGVIVMLTAPLVGAISDAVSHHTCVGLSRHSVACLRRRLRIPSHY